MEKQVYSKKEKKKRPKFNCNRCEKRHPETHCFCEDCIQSIVKGYIEVYKLEVVCIIENRIKKCQYEKKRIVNTIDNKTKIHPAWKQLNGRVQELRYLRKRLNKEVRK